MGGDFTQSHGKHHEGWISCCVALQFAPIVFGEVWMKVSIFIAVEDSGMGERRKEMGV